MGETWEIVKSVTEVLSSIVVPVLGWMLWTVLSHGKQIIVLEEKVNDSLNRRMESIEQRVVSMENKIEKKIDGLERNVVEAKIAINSNATNLSNINNTISQKFDAIISKIEDIT